MTVGETVPAAIWEAARRAFAEAGGCAEERLSAALKTAEPLIAAAALENCARLAEKHHAHYGCPVSISVLLRDGGVRPFAGLLRNQAPASEVLAGGERPLRGAAVETIAAAGRERCAQLQAALTRHMQWCEAKDGTKLCGGCLDDWPCPDAGLLRDQHRCVTTIIAEAVAAERERCAALIEQQKELRSSSWLAALLREQL